MSSDVIELRIEERLGGAHLLDLTIPATSSKRYLIVPDGEYEHAGVRYRIVEVEDIRSGSTVTTTARCEALWYRLADEVTPGTTTLSEVTPAAGLALIMANSSWTVGSNSTAATGTYSMAEDDKTTLELLRTWAKITGTYLSFDTVNETVDLTDASGATLDAVFRYRRNIRGMRRRARPPAVTRLYAYGKDDLTIAGQEPSGLPYVEDLSYYTAKGLTADEAADRYTKARVWVDTSYISDVDLYAAAQAKLAELAAEVVSYEIDAVALSELGCADEDYHVGDTVRVYDPDIAVDDAGTALDLTGTVVRTVKYPLEPWRNELEVSFRELVTEADSVDTARSDTATWELFTGRVEATSALTLRNDISWTVARIPLRFTGSGQAHWHVDMPFRGVGSGTATWSVYDSESSTTIAQRVVSYSDGATSYATMTWAEFEQSGQEDYRLRVQVSSSGGASSASGIDFDPDVAGEARFYVLAQNAVREAPTAPNTQRFDYNGAGNTGTVQQFTVPDNVDEVTVELYGAGGSDGAGGNNGGSGGYVKFSMPVTGGQIIDVYAPKGGGTYSGPTTNVSGSDAGWGGGAGNGDGGDGGQITSSDDGGGGGGAAWVVAEGGTIASAYGVAGGGAGAGSQFAAGVHGGNGGFFAGAPGILYYTLGGAVAAQGGTQSGGGSGELQPSDAGSGVGGPGSLGQGGDGNDSSNAFRSAGGGGGGGYYGGGAGYTPTSAAIDGGGGGGGGCGYVYSGAYNVEITDGGGAGELANGYVIFSWSTPV